MRGETQLDGWQTYPTLGIKIGRRWGVGLFDIAFIARGDCLLSARCEFENMCLTVAQDWACAGFPCNRLLG